MFAISCSACQKKLSVNENLAGKKVKCPGCGHVTMVPSQTAPVGNEGMRTVPPAPIPDEPTISPKPVDASDTPTNPSLSKPDATQDAKNESSHDSSLTDFLAPPQADDELGRLGKYRILKILGHGGMGVVFLGEDPKLGRKVAIKAMLPHLAHSKTSLQRFLREAHLAATLEHDHIVPIFQIDEDRGAPYIVMPFLKGEPLDECLKHGHKIPLAEILRIGREIAEALSAAHALGLVHRDIKPANVWLEQTSHARHETVPGLSLPDGRGSLGRVRILDFGLARSTTDEAHLTQSGAIVGTPAYMAPEQCRGEKLDARCDLWSLGVVLYRMCTGALPFKGTDTLSTMRALEMTVPPPPAQVDAAVPAALSDLVMNLLEKDRAKRTGSADEVVLALQAQEEELTRKKAERENTVPVATPRPPRRRPVSLFAVALLAVFGVLALGAGGVYYWQTNNGTVRIEINDPDIKVAFDKNGPIITGADQKDIKLTPGEFGLRVERGDLIFDTDKFILKRGETIALKIEWFKEGKLQVVREGTVIGKAAMAKAAPPTTSKGPAVPMKPMVDPTEPATIDYALGFDGKSRVDIPNPIVDPTGPTTIEAYVTFPKYVKQRSGIVHFAPRLGLWISSDEDSFDFGYSVPGTLSLRSKLYFQDQWHPRFHVAGVRDEKELRIYVDGKFQGREKLAQLGRVDTMDSLIIGNAVIGMIDEIRFSKVARYDKDFTPKTRFERDADTLALYHCDEGSGDVLNDSSGNGHHGKIVGAKWVKAAEVPKNATPPTTSEGPADPERKAAESLIPFADLTLELKSGKRTLIRAGGKLPAGPFKVTAIGFSHAYNKDLPATFVGATLLPAIAELQSLTAIRNHFDQVETVTGEELARLSKMPAAKTIKVLWLRFQLTSSAVDSLARFPSLVSIHCMAEQTDGATLSRLKELPKLKELSFLGLGKAGPITDKGIDDLCSLELTSIGIHRSNIVDARLAAKLASMPRVEHIRLGASGVDDAIVAALNRGTAKLTTLDVNTNRVTDAGLAHLKNLTTLRVLSVGFNPKVTEAGAMKLSDALPKCKIELGGGKVIGPKDKTTPPPVEPDDPTPEAALPPLDPASVPLFNGKDLAGWKVMGNPGWSVKDGVLVGETKGPPGWLMSEKDYADFELSLEYKQAAGGDSGVFLRASPEGAVWQFMQIELIDDAKAADPKSRTGALFDTIAPNPPPKATVNEWHRLDIRLQGRQLQVMFDDQKILATNLDDHKAQLGRHPGLGKATGRIGLEINRGKIEFKNIHVRELLPAKAAFPPLDPARLKAVAAMKPEQQVEAVKAEPTNAIPASTARSSAKSKPVSWPR